MLTLKDIMTADVATVTPAMTLREAAALLAARGVTEAPVLRDGKVVGIVCAADMLELAASADTTPRTGPEPDAAAWMPDEAAPAYGAPVARQDLHEALARMSEEVREPPPRPDVGHDVLGEHTVEQAMRRRLWVLSPDADVVFAAQVMARNRLHAVIVGSGGTLAGIATVGDVARALADGRLA